MHDHDHKHYGHGYRHFKHAHGGQLVGMWIMLGVIVLLLVANLLFVSFVFHRQQMMMCKMKMGMMMDQGACKGDAKSHESRCAGMRSPCGPMQPMPMGQCPMPRQPMMRGGCPMQGGMMMQHMPMSPMGPHRQGRMMPPDGPMGPMMRGQSMTMPAMPMMQVRAVRAMPAIPLTPVMPAECVGFEGCPQE